MRSNKGIKQSAEWKAKKGFRKGNIPWNKGKKGVQVGYWKGGQRPDNIERNKKRIWTEESKRKYAAHFIGKKHSKEHNRKISEALKGNKSGIGRKHSKETKQKISIAQKGEKGNNWKGGITPINMLIRCSREYKLWRIAVFERDNYTCVWCFQRGGKLHVDHIKPFSDYSELRLAIDNGRTLCVPCHEKTDSYKGRAKRGKKHKVSQNNVNNF